jgi:2-phosphoglycerate kinase
MMLKYFLTEICQVDGLAEIEPALSKGFGRISSIAQNRALSSPNGTIYATLKLVTKRLNWLQKESVAKLFIIENATGEKIPFLRGVMVESLARVGLSFQDAYLVAQFVRDSFDSSTEITVEALKKQVAAELRRRFGESQAESYVLGSSTDRQIMVETDADQVPFSAGILSRSLQACAIDRADALEAAKQVHDYLRKGEATVVDHLALRQIIHERLKVHCSQSAADRFLSWQRFRDSGRPLIVLVGGITGTGKSTLTTELAYQLNIVRTQSTDMMREIVRCYLPDKKIPTLSYSSFEAWRGLNKDAKSTSDVDDRDVIRGFLSQFGVVKHGLEATIRRAVKENYDLIIDGVHVLPSKLELDISLEQAIVIPIMLVVPNKKMLGKRLKRRAREQPERASSRYLKQLEKIWTLQSFLVTEAEDHETPLIFNADIEEALQELLLHISNTITEQFPATA